MAEEPNGPKLKNYPMELKWEEPVIKRPAPRHPPEMYDPLLEKIKERPGEWARLRVMTQGSAYGMLKRLRKIWREQEPRWQFEVNPIPGASGEAKEMRGLYARYRTDEQMEEG